MNHFGFGKVNKFMRNFLINCFVLGFGADALTFCSHFVPSRISVGRDYSMGYSSFATHILLV